MLTSPTLDKLRDLNLMGMWCAFQRIRTTNPAESGHLIQSKADTVGAERRRDVFGCQ